MVTFFGTTLAISLLGIIIVLGLKRFEMRTGRTLFVRMRPFLNRFFHRILVWVEYILPDTVENRLRRVGYILTGVVRVAVVRGMRLFEAKLERLLMQVREKTRPPQGGNKEASSYLRKVADYKRSLDAKPGEHAIFEE